MFRLRQGERFRYVYDYGAHWQCDIRLEAIVPRDSKRFYPVCIAAKRAAPPEECGAPGRIWRSSISIAIIRLLKPCSSPLMPSEPCWTRTPRPRSVQEAVGELDALQDAVDCLEAYQQFQPEHVDRRTINAQLRAWPWQRGEEP